MQFQTLLVELNGLARIAQIGVGKAEIAEGVAFPAPVADLAGNGQRLLVELNGVVRVAQSGTDKAEITEGLAFLPAIPSKPGGFGLHFQPTDALVRVESQNAGFMHRVHQGNQQWRRFLVSPRLEPVERCVQMRPLVVEQHQSSEDVFLAFLVEFVCLPCHANEMPRVSSFRSVQFFRTGLIVRELAEQIMQIETFRFRIPFEQAQPQQ